MSRLLIPSALALALSTGCISDTGHPAPAFALLSSPGDITLTWHQDFNGVDDNTNAVVDESGLAFDMAGEIVNIHLTIERQGPQGDWLPATRTIQVACRN